VIQNGDSSKAQFKLRIFSFINNSIVYLHCKLRVCMERPGAPCKIVSVWCPGLLADACSLLLHGKPPRLEGLLGGGPDLADLV
jgi:hypothetical protein